MERITKEMFKAWFANQRRANVALRAAAKGAAYMALDIEPYDAELAQAFRDNAASCLKIADVIDKRGEGK